MASFADSVQSLMDEFYTEWQKAENNGKSKWDVLGSFSEAHQIAVLFGNFNYQVGNGGLEQWIYNGYLQDDAEKFAVHLAAYADSDDRCQIILDNVNQLDQSAKETDCRRDGSFYDEDGESGFIGDILDCDKFDTWYYEHCGNDDWWEFVCSIIDKAEARDSAHAHQDDSTPDEATAIAPVSDDTYKSSPLQVYIENANNPDIGGFTIPLPQAKETLAPWFSAIEVDGNNPDDIAVREIKSPMDGLLNALGYGSYPLDELNYLALKIDEIKDYDLAVFLAALETSKYSRNIATLINLTENLYKFELQPAFSVEQYGEFLLQHAKDISGPAFERLEQSADDDDKALCEHILKLESLVEPRSYGITASQEEQGSFTEYGYLVLRDEFRKIYYGHEDIPEEYRIFPPEEAIPEAANALEEAPPFKASDFMSNDVLAESKSTKGAVQNLSEQRTPHEKASVMSKLREAKTVSKSKPQTERKAPVPGKSGPEL